MSGHSDTYGTEVYNDTPTAYWRFDGDGVDEMAGTSMTLTNGATYGTTIVSTYSGAQAGSFDGTNDYASVPDAAKFDYTTDMSAEAWINLSRVTGTQGILGKVDWGLGTSGTTLRFFTLNPTVVVSWGTAASTSTDYHIVATLTGTALVLYINGSQVATNTRAAALTQNGFAVEVGAWNVSTDFLQGRVDECALWNRALTAQEVADHYTAGTGGTPGASKSSVTLRRPARGLILR